MRFVDQAQVTIRSGKGGHGCVSFRREKYVPKGGPDGGDGGKGGDVIFRAEPRLLTLYDISRERTYEAENGRPGSGAQKNGRMGADMVVPVPVGTLIHEINPDEEERTLADLDEPEASVLAAKGGRGGKGNTHFKSSTMRAPRFAQPGEQGEEKRLRLELKLLADAGLLGLPNAGKSTFLSAVSAARPKIAPYPFTTLSPNLGVLVDDVMERLVVADIPGLIQGAHEGLGLGHQFLRHVDRTRFLVHILSVEEVGLEDPWAGFGLLNQELKHHSADLSQRPQVEVINKIDICPKEQLEMLKARAKAEDRKIFFISALYGQGLDELVDEIWRLHKKGV